MGNYPERLPANLSEFKDKDVEGDNGTDEWTLSRATAAREIEFMVEAIRTA